jgi:hypothetical protein
MKTAEATACRTNKRRLPGVPQLLLLLLLILALTRHSFAGCDGFLETGGGCGTGGDVICFTVNNGFVTITGISGFDGQGGDHPDQGPACNQHWALRVCGKRRDKGDHP